MRIILMGYMGSGKSSVGAQLARILSYKFIDFDTYIENEESRSISQIFDQKGEIYFRLQESNYLAKILKEEENQIILSLGGGTPCYGNNIDLIKESNSLLVYLNTSVQELTKRLWKEKEQRPLIKNQSIQDDLEEFIRKHLFERGFYYNQADTIIKTDQKTIDILVKEIVAQLF